MEERELGNKANTDEIVKSENQNDMFLKEMNDMMEEMFGKKLTDGDKEINNKIMNLLKNKEIPDKYPRCFLGGMYDICQYERREEVIKLIGYSLISWDWIEQLCSLLKGKKCLEIMSGLGALSYALKLKDIDIKATDNFSWSFPFNERMWTDVENIDCIEAIEKYGRDTDYIIMSWPYMDDTAYRSLLKMREVNPNCKMIYIGESSGGCNADEDFFEVYTEIGDEFVNEANYLYPRWGFIHDNIYLIK